MNIWRCLIRGWAIIVGDLGFIISDTLSNEASVIFTHKDMHGPRSRKNILTEWLEARVSETDLAEVYATCNL